MPAMVNYLFTTAYLNNLAEIHYGNACSHMIDDTKIMRNDEKGQTQFVS